MDKARILKLICEALQKDDADSASKIARSEYPFTPIQSSKRRNTPQQSVQIFVRDGFIDRYSGHRLVYPGALRLLSLLLPEEFPAHPNWKMSESHIVYWELFPTIDHVLPVARGGADDESNWVTTSMLRNSAKSNWTLEELGWELLPAGDFNEWDGLSDWFRSYVDSAPQFLGDGQIQKWYRAIDVAC